jgi:hypothetical protein
LANEITFGNLSGKTLTYAVYQPNGSVRTAAGTSLPEVGSTGYYVASNASIIAGDFVIVKESTVVVGQGQYKPEVSSTDIKTEVDTILVDTHTTIPATLAIIEANQNRVNNVYNEETPPPITVINL